MGRFSGYLLACDMDGTLVSSGVIPQRNIDAIRMFTQEGGTFALATGRGPTAVSHALEKVGEYVGPSVVANGCMIYDYSKNEILMQKEIDNNFKEFVIKSAELFDEIGIEVHAGKGKEGRASGVCGGELTTLGDNAVAVDLPKCKKVGHISHLLIGLTPLYPLF